MNCIIAINFLVLINGVAKNLVHLKKTKLRQECPLSLYILIMSAKVLKMLVLAENQNLIHDLRFSKNISVTHLLFANDSLVFIRASTTYYRNVNEIFDTYTTASGQVFNFEKFSMVFNTSLSKNQMEEISSIFRLNVVSKHEKYLGLPSMGRRRLASLMT